jgi:hypothetical protein
MVRTAIEDEVAAVACQRIGSDGRLLFGRARAPRDPQILNRHDPTYYERIAVPSREPLLGRPLNAWFWRRRHRLALVDDDCRAAAAVDAREWG